MIDTQDKFYTAFSDQIAADIDYAEVYIAVCVYPQPFIFNVL